MRAKPTRTTTQRGYGAKHQAERRRWEPIVAAGRAVCCRPICLRPDRRIHPDEPWDLGHSDDRTRWTGPEHRGCNRAAGARKGNRSPIRRRRRTSLQPIKITRLRW